MAEVIIWREPEVFASGDSLIFQRSLPGYLPSNGWSITGTLTQPGEDGGGAQVAQYTSTPDPTGKFHLVNVPNFAAGLNAGIYVLSEEVVCGAGGVNPGEKHQIYIAELKLDPDLADGLATGELLTFEEQMIPIIQAKIKRLESFDLSQADAQRTNFYVEERNKAYDRLKWLLERVHWQKSAARQKNTGQDQMVIQTMNAGGW
jgi:hypothetical protein